MKDSLPHDYEIKFFETNGVEPTGMKLCDVEMDWSDDNILIFTKGYGEVAAIVNKAAIKYIFRRDIGDVDLQR